MARLEQTQQTSRFIREDTRGGDPRTTSRGRSMLPASDPSHAVTANEGSKHVQFRRGWRKVDIQSRCCPPAAHIRGTGIISTELACRYRGPSSKYRSLNWNAVDVLGSRPVVGGDNSTAAGQGVGFERQVTNVCDDAGTT